MDQKSVIFNLSKLAILTTALPLSAFVLCISLSLISNFNESTSTHCKVTNYLPSISASIGNFSPQKYIWRICIALHSSPRFLISYLHYAFWHHNLLALVFNLIEISSLIGLSFISSIENFPIHAKFFTMFILASFIYMFIILKHRLRHHHHRKEIRYYCALSNIIAGLFAVFFYYRHNWYCEPGIYTLFAFSEYVVVISNILFHFQTYFDLRRTQAILIEKSNMDHKIDYDDQVRLI